MTVDLLRLIRYDQPEPRIRRHGPERRTNRLYACNKVAPDVDMTSAFKHGVSRRFIDPHWTTFAVEVGWPPNMPGNHPRQTPL